MNREELAGKEGPCVWVTGAGGLIGHELVRQARQRWPDWEVVGLTRGELDLEDFKAVERRFRQDRPDWVVHAAGWTRSPACEADPVGARRANVEVTAHLAGLAEHAGLVFFSTDLVFDGRQGWYRETDSVHPLSVYGATKAEAEARVLERPGHLVVRTSLNYGRSPTGDRSFNEDMERAWGEGRRMTLFTDEYRCPIPVVATAGAVWRLVDRVMAAGLGEERPSGLYHVAGVERLSRWDMGVLVAGNRSECLGLLVAGTRAEYRGAPRPADTSLVCDRVGRWLEEPLPGLRKWMKDAR